VLCARRFKELLDADYFDGCRFHRVVSDFIVQWGIPGDPGLYRKFGDNKIRDDPVKHTNARGTISFATSGPNARGSQMFINYDNNNSLDDQGSAFPPGPCVRTPALSPPTRAPRAVSRPSPSSWASRASATRWRSTIATPARAPISRHARCPLPRPRRRQPQQQQQQQQQQPTLVDR
jgi:hypothetical protein